MNAKKANIIFWVLLVAGALISGIGSTEGMQWMAMLGIAVMVGGLLLKMHMGRCPHCGMYIGRSAGGVCPNCGEKLGE